MLCDLCDLLVIISEAYVLAAFGRVDANPIGIFMDRFRTLKPTGRLFDAFMQEQKTCFLTLEAHATEESI
ncbi:hypothetical protein Pan54_21780 [Rubinisphaera italica]|uniref:Uncharacterized protein n=1 Tax=Rubinisphaera italica TaxID=2527969 RepID=A0A5C5XHY9_9PLAN|nr:hypothetical protein Pan54_21780 [Rubinisphaera italica]